LIQEKEGNNEDSNEYGKPSFHHKISKFFHVHLPLNPLSSYSQSSYAQISLIAGLRE